ncbi:MAG TPA: sigma-70 family RNA polymerase sigma factor [Polyangiaceae bacterium]|nr:sigma-70 family RNA polymerase sigma factor [Polyangiaceae bacterium]
MLSEGTRSAQQELEQKLRPFVARRVPPADIDDVLQDVFVRVQQALSGLRDQDRFVPWLYQVARSAVQENLRQRARHPLAASADEPPAPESDEADPSAGGLAAYAAAAIERLPSPYREALTLTELQGLTQQAAAEALGISVSGMKSRVQRGREKLREIIEECCAIALDVRGGVIDCEPRRPGQCACSKS